MKLLKGVVAAVTALAVSVGAAPVAGAYLETDNVLNITRGGGVNCNGKNVTCFEKVGDKVRVEYTLQFSNGVSSDDHGQTARGRAVAVPSVIEDLTLDLVSVPEGESDEDFPTRGPVGSQIVNKNVSLKNFFDGEGWSDQAGGNLDITTPKDEFYASWIKGEDVFTVWDKGLEPDFKENRDVIPANSLSSSGPSTPLSTIAIGDMSRDSQYDILVFGTAARPGVTTLKLSGWVTTQSESTYLPIRIRDVFWKCSQEGGGAGSDSEGCQSLAEYEWGRIESPLPEYSLTDQRITEANKRNHTAHGLNGASQCAVTEDLAVTRGTAVRDEIGADVAPRTLRYGHGQIVETQSFAVAYANTFTLKANQQVVYHVAGYGVNEDGCDQAGILIEQCPDAKKPHEGTIVLTIEPSKSGNLIVKTPQEGGTVTVKEPGYKVKKGGHNGGTTGTTGGVFTIVREDGEKIVVPGAGPITITWTNNGTTITNNVTINNDGTITVTNVDNRGGDGGSSSGAGTGTATGNGEGSSVDDKCIAAIVGLTAPLLLLIPLGILSQIQIPGFEHVHAQLNAATRQINDDIQRVLGIHDARRAENANEMANQAQAAAAQAGPLIGAAAGALGAIAVALAIGDGVMRACGKEEATSSYQISKLIQANKDK